MECTLPILYSFQLPRSFQCAVTKEVYDCSPVLCHPSPFKVSLFFLQEIVSVLKGSLEFAARTHFRHDYWCVYYNYQNVFSVD